MNVSEFCVQMHGICQYNTVTRIVFVAPVCFPLYIRIFFAIAVVEQCEKKHSLSLKYTQTRQQPNTDDGLSTVCVLCMHILTFYSAFTQSFVHVHTHTHTHLHSEYILK